VYTDSATVYGLVKSVIKGSKRPEVSGHGEMLIRRCLSMIAELIETYNLHAGLYLVKYENNLADKLIMVPKHWLTPTSCVVSAVKDIPSLQVLRDLHDSHVYKIFYYCDILF